MSHIPPITPQTKVAELLDAYPELEDVLIGLAPAFKKLKNPVLRRTVARLTTLETAAGVAGIPPRDLVTALRQAANQPVGGPEATGGGPPVARQATEQSVPAWFHRDRIRQHVDADELLAKGEPPVSEVLRCVRALSGDDILRVTASFEPVPLLEILQKQGHRSFIWSSKPGCYELFVAAGDVAR